MFDNRLGIGLLVKHVAISVPISLGLVGVVRWVVEDSCNADGIERSLEI